jgi:hypothetical protein
VIAAHAPIPLTAPQEVAVKQLGGYAVRLVGFTRTIDTGVEVKLATVVVLRSSIARWRSLHAALFRGRLAPVASLALRSAGVLTAIDAVESQGGHAATVRYRNAAVAFNAAAAAFGAMRFVQRAR